MKNKTLLCSTVLPTFIIFSGCTDNDETLLQPVERYQVTSEDKRHPVFGRLRFNNYPLNQFFTLAAISEFSIPNSR